MIKKYYSPMLQIVSISKRDILTNSLMRGADAEDGYGDAPERRIFDLDYSWDAGY